MGLRNATPIKFSPAGVCDALDSSNVFRGAMLSLQNLIPDPSTKNLWECRPAAIQQTDFASFTTPGFISGAIIVGTKVFGLVASGLNAGKDQPFCFDLSTGLFVTVTGITNPNTPTSPQSIGAWTPPTMAVVGPYVIVTHPGFTGAGGIKFGYFNITNPAAPTWSAGDTATNALAAVPSAVAQFGQRAYFIVNLAAQPNVTFTDVLNPLSVTNANQILTFGDNVTLTALGPLPLNNQLGGIIQSLMVFKGYRNIFQITGDSATNDLTVNSLNVATGTLTQSAVAATPKGLAFVSAEGIRVIDTTAKVSDPVGNWGNGVTVPFIFAVEPTRVVLGCNADTLRASVQNGNTVNDPMEEYWYDLARSVWSGPHSFPASLMLPYGNTFIMAASGVDAKLFQSNTVQHADSTFVENGTQMSFIWQTALLPDTEQMCENAILEQTINMALVASGDPCAVQAINGGGQILDSVIVTPTVGTTIWGNFTWGQAQWQSGSSGLVPVPINWTVPIVFRKLSTKVNGNSYLGYRIGDMFMRYERLGYLQMVA